MQSRAKKWLVQSNPQKVKVYNGAELLDYRTKALAVQCTSEMCRS